MVCWQPLAKFAIAGIAISVASCVTFDKRPSFSAERDALNKRQDNIIWQHTGDVVYQVSNSHYTIMQALILRKFPDAAPFIITSQDANVVCLDRHCPNRQELVEFMRKHDEPIEDRTFWPTQRENVQDLIDGMKKMGDCETICVVEYTESTNMISCRTSRSLLKRYQKLVEDFNNEK